jgi:aldehyde dehydrogenase family 7 protein A1
MGKILAEGKGEVQEAIDICDFAVGLSRTYSGSVIPSERPGHFMMERWNPLNGACGIVTAFNFPVAVFFWNLALSLVVGNVNIWKPSQTTPLTSLAVMKLLDPVLSAHNLDGVVTMALGNGEETGDTIVKSNKVELVSFTGSTRVGRIVGQECAKRFAKTLLELG